MCIKLETVGEHFHLQTFAASSIIYLKKHKEIFSETIIVESKNKNKNINWRLFYIFLVFLLLCHSCGKFIIKCLKVLIAIFQIDSPRP